MNNKFYVQVSLADHEEIITNHVFKYNGEEYMVSDNIVESISKQSGVSSTMMKIYGRYPELLVRSVIAGCEYYYGGTIDLLIYGKDVVRVSFNKNIPLLNTEFVDIMNSMLDDYKDVVSIESSNIEEESFTSEIVIYPNEEFVYQDQSYNLGVVFENDELDTVSCKLVVKKGLLKFYMPSKYFNLSASRYMRTSSDMKEALRQLVLKVLESIMNRDNWFSPILLVNTCIQNSLKIQATYEEYKSVVRLLNQITVESEMDTEEYNDLKDSLEDSFLSDFLEKYPAFDDKKGSYIWRCSALGDSTIFDLVEYINRWRVNKVFYPSCENSIMYLIGEFLMTDRISTNLARRKQ